MLLWFSLIVTEKERETLQTNYIFNNSYHFGSSPVKNHFLLYCKFFECLLQISICSKFLFQISTNGKSQKKHIFAIFKGKKKFC